MSRGSVAKKRDDDSDQNGRKIKSREGKRIVEMRIEETERGGSGVEWRVSRHVSLNICMSVSLSAYLF